MKSLKRKKKLNKTGERTPIPVKKVFPHLFSGEKVTVTFDDIAGCDSVLLVLNIIEYLCVCTQFCLCICTCL